MLPKTLQADPRYANDIHDQDGHLVINVGGSSEDPSTYEFRDEIIHRWNSYRILRDGLAAISKMLDEQAAELTRKEP